MKILDEPITKDELKKIAEKMFGNLVKGVVDIEKEIMAIDAELHVDLAELLVSNGSTNKNLWGINIYPDETGENWLEFDSMINLKPQFNNRTRGVEDPVIRERITEFVADYFFFGNEYNSTPELWRHYFDAFAYAANR